MIGQTRQQVLALVHDAHALTETAYRADATVKGGQGWDEKQRILMADMALHLVQAALQEGELDTARLKQNLYAILTIGDLFLPSDGLAQHARQQLLDQPDLTIK